MLEIEIASFCQILWMRPKIPDPHQSKQGSAGSAATDSWIRRIYGLSLSVCHFCRHHCRHHSLQLCIQLCHYFVATFVANFVPTYVAVVANFVLHLSPTLSPSLQPSLSPTLLPPLLTTSSPTFSPPTLPPPSGMSPAFHYLSLFMWSLVWLYCDCAAADFEQVKITRNL